MDKALDCALAKTAESATSFSQPEYIRGSKVFGTTFLQPSKRCHYCGLDEIWDRQNNCPCQESAFDETHHPRGCSN